jgi:hypothetical protein
MANVDGAVDLFFSPEKDHKETGKDHKYGELDFDPAEHVLDEDSRLQEATVDYDDGGEQADSQDPSYVLRLLSSERIEDILAEHDAIGGSESEKRRPHCDEN